MSATKWVGWGFIPLPGEKRRRARAEAEARRIMDLVREAQERGE